MHSKVTGQLSLEILQDNERLLDEFESAFRSVVKTYIESSSINVLELEVKKENGLIEVLYAFDAVILSYENSKKEKRTATTHSAEFGRALFAFWGPTNKTRKTYAKQISTWRKPIFPTL
ncbi:hypothetical protein GJU41_24345, partial [Bacillus idriensis]